MTARAIVSPIAFALVASFVVIGAACSEKSGSNDANGNADTAVALDASDAGPGTDGEAVDAVSVDATTASDSGNVDAGGSADTSAPSDAAAQQDGGGAVPDAQQTGVATPYGSITGACGTIFSALKSTKPAFITNTYLFKKTATFDASKLSKGAKKRFDGPNAGGSSKCTEVMSMQVFFDCEKATVHKTETEIKYDKQGAITDYMLDHNGTKLGVSVTRAYKGPMGTTYSKADATKLLSKKLNGINESSANVSAADKWSRQVLHVWTMRPDWIAPLNEAWKALPEAARADTIVVVTVEQGIELIVPNKCD